MCYVETDNHFRPNALTHCSLVIPYGDIGPGQHWLSVDLSPSVFYGIDKFNFIGNAHALTP